MSMFHELMMRKKEEIMYATIKGSLTENDGVFSGFSDSNYLQLQDHIAFNTNFNITIKFRYSGTTSGIQAIFSWTSKLYIYIASNGRLYARTQHNNSWDITISTTSALSVDTDYILSFIKNGNDYSLILNGTEIGTQISSNTIDTSIYNATFGKTSSTDVFTNGSIDLNNSYIKLGSTKYNLQAVVGWTKVGEPTIVDGVVSGFSASNYLSLGNHNLNFGYNNFEIVTKIKTTVDNTLQYFLYLGLDSETNSQSCINVMGNGAIRLIAKNISSTDKSLTGIDYTDYIWVRLMRKGNLVNFSYSYDGISYVAGLDFDCDKSLVWNIPCYIGNAYGYNDRYFKGQIDLNNTYIKINNKLWFNGQQA